LAYNKKDYPSSITHSQKGASKVELSDLELNTSLLALPGQMISGDPIGCNLFCKKFAKNRLSQRITFEDFINAFLPVKLDQAKALLRRPQKLAKDKEIKDLKDIFGQRTYAQFTLAWKSYF